MDFLKSITGKNKPKDVAKDRLKLILIHDRADITPEILNNMKEDILEVLAKYAEIYQEDVEVTLTSVDEMKGCSPALVANVPIKRIKN